MSITERMRATTGHDDRSVSDSDHIIGMMPSFDVWQDARAAFVAENEATRRGLMVDSPRRPPVRAVRKRAKWPLFAAVLVVGLVSWIVLSVRQADPASVTRTTPVEQLPWAAAETPSGSLRVDLPAKAAAGSITSVAGSGQQLTASVPGFDVMVASFSLAGGPNEARELVGALLNERAELLNGHMDRFETANSRVGQSFEGVVITDEPAAIVRVVLDGMTIYLLEIRGDVASVRGTQIFDQVVQSFQPTSTR